MTSMQLYRQAAAQAYMDALSCLAVWQAQRIVDIQIHVGDVDVTLKVPWIDENGLQRASLYYQPTSAFFEDVCKGVLQTQFYRQMMERLEPAQVPTEVERILLGTNDHA